MTRPQAWTPETKPLWLISDPDERMRRSVVESLEPQRRPKRTREPSRWPRSTVAAAPQVSGSKRADHDSRGRGGRGGAGGTGDGGA